MKTLLKSILYFLFIFQFCAARAQVPVLNSYPSASATLFLDFDGQFVYASSWNWNGPIAAASPALNDAAITEIVNRVSEDFRPFNLNVTTDSAKYFAAPATKRIRIIVTPTYEWYGQAGGASFVGSFNWGDGTPAFVFSNLLGNSVKNIAEAISHEAGHSMGLQHQSIYDANCQKLVEYNGGQGSGEIGWAPIMGVGYYKNLTTWHVGTNTINCQTIQNDMDIIGTAVNGLRTDDHGNRHQAATAVMMNGQSFAATGIINSMADVDVFSFSTAQATRLTINVIPQHVGTGNEGANIDIKLSLLNHRGDTLASYNPSALLSVGIDTNIGSGNYFLVVDGVGNINHAEDGSVGYYALSGMFASALPVRKFMLKGNATRDGNILNWTYEADETIWAFEPEMSLDGKSFQPLATISAAQKNYLHGQVLGTQWYRIKAATARQQYYYSNIIAVQPYSSVAGVKPVYDVSAQRLMVLSTGIHAYQLYDASGRLLQKGAFSKGSNSIEIPSVYRGLLLCQWQDDTGMHVYKFIKQ